MTVPIMIAAAVTLAVLAFGGWMTPIGPWYHNLRKPSWQPPRWAFAPAWTIIMGLAAWAGLLAWANAPEGRDRWIIIGLFAINYLFHMAWSPLFFKLRRPDWALVEMVFLWLSIVALMLGLARYSPAAPWMLTPYLVWVSFAWFLNRKIVQLNGPFRPAHAT